MGISLKRGIALCSIFTAGMIVGAIIVGLLSVRASRLYIQMVRLSFASEETQRASEALRRGEALDASRHAGCGIDVEGNTSTFDPVNTMWTLSFPLLGAWVTERTKYPVADRTQLVALAHARFGVILERMGRTEEANQEFAEAGRLSGRADITTWRKAGLVTLGQAPQ